VNYEKSSPTIICKRKNNKVKKVRGEKMLKENKVKKEREKKC